MATPLLARTIRVVINAHRGLDRRANVLHFQVSGTDVTPGLVDAATIAVKNFCTADYKNACSSSVVFDNVTGTDASRTNGYQHVEALTGLVGAGASDAAPGNACPVVTLHTAQPGRSGRGRVYTFDPDRGYALPDDTWQPALQVALQTMFNNLLTATQATGQYVLAVGSRKGLCSFPVTSVQAHTYIASQKDRLPGHRKHKKHHTP